MVRIGVTGVAGRMGREIALSVLAIEGVALAGGTEAKGHPGVGRGLMAELGQANGGPIIKDKLAEIIDDVDAIIDFTAPSATMEHFRIVADRGKSMVIGTTGFTEEQLAEIRGRASDVRCVIAPNMSVGVNVVFKLVEEAVKVLGSTYDMEIVEMHHRLKKDSPSGTAARLAEICAAGTGRDLSSVGVYGREGIVGERKPEEIGIMSLRGGDVVGEHTVIFAGKGERVEISHKAASRSNFAEGAVRAAIWLAGQKPGIYDMQDVLGLRS